MAAGPGCSLNGRLVRKVFWRSGFGFQGLNRILPHWQYQRSLTRAYSPGCGTAQPLGHAAAKAMRILVVYATTHLGAVQRFRRPGTTAFFLSSRGNPLVTGRSPGLRSPLLRPLYAHRQLFGYNFHLLEGLSHARDTA